MTTMEMNSMKQSMVEQLLSLDNMAALNRLQKYLNRLQHEAEREEVITKEELIAGIDAGLKDVKAGRTRPAHELLKEL
ncbi:MAG: hypothetical protein LBN24_08550 [Mediterranea sp.]|jgi:predicted transcriptional regulator|nr:hypothetical protein [Mediterranea sp.]